MDGAPTHVVAVQIPVDGSVVWREYLDCLVVAGAHAEVSLRPSHARLLSDDVAQVVLACEHVVSTSRQLDIGFLSLLATTLFRLNKFEEVRFFWFPRGLHGLTAVRPQALPVLERIHSVVEAAEKSGATKGKRKADATGGAAEPLQVLVDGRVFSSARPANAALFDAHKRAELKARGYSLLLLAAR
jgi:hypothetical protein